MLGASRGWQDSSRGGATLGSIDVREGPVYRPSIAVASARRTKAIATSQNAYGDKAGIVTRVDRMPRTPMTTAIHQVMTFGGLSLMLASLAALVDFPIGSGIRHQGLPRGQRPDSRTANSILAGEDHRSSHITPIPGVGYREHPQFDFSGASSRGRARPTGVGGPLGERDASPFSGAFRALGQANVKYTATEAMPDKAWPITRKGSKRGRIRPRHPSLRWRRTPGDPRLQEKEQDRSRHKHEPGSCGSRGGRVHRGRRSGRIRMDEPGAHPRPPACLQDRRGPVREATTRQTKGYEQRAWLRAPFQPPGPASSANVSTVEPSRAMALPVRVEPSTEK
jgi:hypothetical protein